MVLLITGTVYPDKEMTSLAIKDHSERLKQYKETINWAIKKINIGKIVFCDNSLCPKEEFEIYKKKAIQNKKEFEYLTFMGNKEKAIKQGKGYGEGEIIEYVLINSQLFQDEDYFVKITGRLRVRNINKILPSMKAIVRINMFNSERVDTRLYGMPVTIYKRFLIHAYYNVDDNNGYYLEHAFTDALKKNDILSKNLSRYPRYLGVSGSTGRTYSSDEFKCIFKDVLSIANCYGLRGR